MLIVFVSIAFGGFLILLVTLLFGGDADTDVDMDGDADGDFDHDGGAGHHWLSVKVLSAFITAFGAGGAIARAYDASMLWSIVTGLVLGLIVGFVADFIIVLFYRQQTTSSFSVGKLAGKTGTVALPILKGKFGEVTVNYKGNSITRRAKNTDAEEEIGQGTLVEIVTADASGFIVKKQQ